MKVVIHCLSVFIRPVLAVMLERLQGSGMNFVPSDFESNV